MTNAESGPQAAPLDSSPRASFWIRELPYILVFILTILGVAYTSYTKKPILGYWELLAPVIALVCISAGWRRAPTRSARVHLIWTQVLHWGAFLLVMTLMLVSEVQRILSAGATGLAILTLLALGTFTAGVHVLSWQVCLLGVIMALGIPAIAWIENSTLLVVIIAGVIIATGSVLWWHWRGSRAHGA